MKNIGVYLLDDQQNRKCVCIIVCIILTSFIPKSKTFALIHGDT